MRFLGLSGSLRAVSINTAVVEALSLLAPEGVAIDIFRGLAELPAFNPDIDDDAPPAKVMAFRALVKACDGIVIAAPEYAHGVPGALKNAMDWLVSSEDFPGKPVVLINTSPRAFHAQAALRETLTTMSARLITEAFVSLPLTGRTLDAQDIAGDPGFSRPLREALRIFDLMIRGDSDS
jgi:chromate reductase